MIFDGFTIIAQAINFLVLVWLMKRFLYKPIHHAIEQRENNISQKIAEADQKKVEAQNQFEDFKQKNSDLDEQRGALLKKATEEAQTEKERLIEEAQHSAAALIKKRTESLKNEEKTMLEGLGIRIQQQVFAVARKAMKDLAGQKLEEQIIHHFIKQLESLDDNEKKNLVSSLHDSPNPITLSTSFEVSETLLAKIEKELLSVLKPDSKVKFEVSQDLICGIEFGTEGQKVRWNLADYLGSLEKDVQRTALEVSKP